MDILSRLQWPAMVVTLVASWLVASKDEQRGNKGFWVILLSNVLGRCGVGTLKLGL